MTVERGTSYTQVPGPKLGVGEPIGQADLSNIAKNQGFVFEKLTGRDVTAPTTSAAGTVTGHDHSEAGNRVLRALLQNEFGSSSKYASDGDATYEVFQQGITYTTDPTVAEAELDSMAVLAFVPRGHNANELMFWIGTGGTNPRMRATVYDSALSVVTGYERVPLRSIDSMEGDANGIWYASGLAFDTVWGFTFEVATAGLYVVVLETTIQAIDEFRLITCVGLAPTWTPYAQNPIRVRFPLVGSNAVTVGDPDNSNAWHPIDSIFTGADSPMHSAGLTLMGHNQNYLVEHATGQAAPGNSTLTLSRGHNHRGTSDTDATARMDGQEIEYPHLCLVWGAKIASSTYTNDITGNRARAVLVEDVGAARTFAKGRIYLPQSLNVNASGNNTSNLKVAVLVNIDGGKGDQVDVTVQLGSTTKTFRSTLAGTGMQILTSPTSGTNNFAYTANAKNTFECSATLNVLVGSSTAYIRAIVAYIDP